MREKIEALLDGETTQMSFRVPKKLIDALRACGQKVYGPLPARGALTTYGLYFLARGIVTYLEEQRKAGAPIVEVDFDNGDPPKIQFRRSGGKKTD